MKPKSLSVIQSFPLKRLPANVVFMTKTIFPSSLPKNLVAPPPYLETTTKRIKDKNVDIVDLFFNLCKYEKSRSLYNGRLNFLVLWFYPSDSKRTLVDGFKAL